MLCVIGGWSNSCENSDSGTLYSCRLVLLVRMKRKHEHVQNEFEFKGTEDRRTECWCKHCDTRVQTALKINTTKLAAHLIHACKKCPATVKEAAQASSQASKKSKPDMSIMPAEAKTLGRESLSDVRSDHTSLTLCGTSKALDHDELTEDEEVLDAATVFTATANPAFPLGQTRLARRTISRAEAMRLMRFDVEFALANFVPFDFFDDVWWKAATLSKEPGRFRCSALRD